MRYACPMHYHMMCILLCQAVAPSPSLSVSDLCLLPMLGSCHDFTPGIPSYHMPSTILFTLVSLQYGCERANGCVGKAETCL